MQTRREFFVAAAAAAAGMGAARVRAAARLALGEMRIDAVSDGALVLPADMLFEDAPREEIAPILARHGVPAQGEIRRDCNLTLMRDGSRTVLFDAGAGRNFMPGAGKLLDALWDMDVDPAAVTHVVFTHGHPDHLWGARDDFGDLTFPEAVHLFPRAEHERWTAEGALEAAPEARKAFVAGARTRLETIAPRLELFEAGAEVLPGVEAVATHGHTAGHVSFALHGGGGSLMIVGDALANAHVAFARPDLPAGMDEDPGLAARTRARLLDRLAGEGTAMLGFHLPFPGLGRVERKGRGYAFAPEEG